MSGKLAGRLARRAGESFVGRDRELALLHQILEREGPLVAHIHGIAGVGKSSLLGAFVAQARAGGATVLELDCRSVEPTERGLLDALGRAAGLASATPSLAELSLRLENFGQPVLLALDTYEVFRLMDTWIRQELLPALPENARVVLAGRQSPIAAWLIAPEWHGLHRAISLGPLGEQETVALLAQAGIDSADAKQLQKLTRGHPLALKLAAAGVARAPDVSSEQFEIQRLLAELTHLYLEEVEDEATREALLAASVLRRVSEPLLRAIRPEASPHDDFERLRALPFVESRSDGLVIHDAVREVLAAALKSQDPKRHRDYRRAAWQQLRDELRDAVGSELWRYTADMLYLFGNPAVREAFFPSSPLPYSVEPARENDLADIRNITERHDGEDAATGLMFWWERQRDAFRVVRDADGEAAGFYCMFDGVQAAGDRAGRDGLTDRWRRHLERSPVGRSEQVLFIRRWLARDEGESPSSVQAACFLDAKRTYLSMRPHLRRVYLALVEPDVFAPAISGLGFRPLPDAAIDLDGRLQHSWLLDFGAGSVDGWLADLVAEELGVEPDGVLDRAARELTLDGTRRALSELEFNLLAYLIDNEGRAVDRSELLDKIWGCAPDAASNVVDVVIGSLRKKLGQHASRLQTVRGVGYRYRSDVD